MDIPPKLMRLIKMTTEGSLARVATQDGDTADINIRKGVRQGDALSTTLFNIALNGTIEATNIRRTIIYSSKQLIAYADDIVLVARESTITHITSETTMTYNNQRRQNKVYEKQQEKCQQKHLYPYKFQEVEEFK